MKPLHAASSPKRKRRGRKCPPRHRPRLRALAESVQGRPGDRRSAIQISRSRPLSHRRCAVRHSFPARPGQRERAELRRQRAGRLRLSSRRMRHSRGARLEHDRPSSRRRAGAGPGRDGVARGAPGSVRTRSRRITTGVRPVGEVLNDGARRLLLPLFGSVALLFLVAAVNVAGLFVARGCSGILSTRCDRRLGASGARLYRQVLVGSAIIALIGAVAGAMIAVWRNTDLQGDWRPCRAPRRTVSVGWPVFAFGLAAALLAALVAGCCRRFGGVDPVTNLADGGRTSAGRRARRMLATIATVQVVFTVALLAGTTLLVRTGTSWPACAPATKPNGFSRSR